jgi:beta-glucanase (GH16 family)
MARSTFVGLTLLLLAACGGTASAEGGSAPAPAPAPAPAAATGPASSPAAPVAADILAGWVRTWQWHATPEGKIWRGDGKRWDPNNGPFLDCYVEWGWLRRLEGNHEQQVFVSPAAWKKAGFNCVFYDPATQSLAIRPRVATLEESAVTCYTQDAGPYKGRAIFSAMLSLEQLTAACPRSGAWRIVARMPGRGVGGAAYQGAWPAIWLMAHKYPMWDGASGPKRGEPFYEKHWELDILEQHARDQSKWYVTDHAEAPFDRAPEKPEHLIATGDTSKTFHEWITVVTDRWWLVYLDGKLIRKTPKTQSAGHPPLYLIFNLAIGGAWFGNVTAESDLSKWEMNLRSIDIYSLPEKFTGDQELPLRIDKK